MNNESIRPLQPVIYLDEIIAKKLSWKGHSPGDILNAEILFNTCGNDQLLLLATLNENLSDGEYGFLPNAIGVDNLLMRLGQSISTDSHREIIKNIKDNLSAKNQKKILQEQFSVDSDDFNEQPFRIEHDERAILVILNNNLNLSEKNVSPSISKDIIRDVVQIMHRYHRPEQVAIDTWFSLYIKNL